MTDPITGDEEPEVGIVGAGPSGIVNAKVFLEDGHDVTVFEKFDEMGGTWSQYRRYLDLSHQLEADLGEFPDKPHGVEYEDAEQFQGYLQEYAEDFGVADRIQFETEVVGVEHTDDDRFRVETRETDPRREFLGEGDPGDTELTEIEGVGPKYAERLREVGVDSAEELAEVDGDVDADELAAAADVPESRLLKWVDRAGDLVTTGGTEVHYFDYVVCCSGINHIPKIPNVPGIDEFEGEILHSSQVREPEAVAGKDVVVVGHGKSARDLSAAIPDHAASTTLVFRKANWFIPKEMFGDTLTYDRVLFSRLGASILPEYPNEAGTSFVDRISQGFKRELWDEGVMPEMLMSGDVEELPSELRPDRILPQDINHAGIETDGYVEALKSGALVPKKAEVEEIDAEGLRLSTGEHVAADVIVMATGWERKVPYVEDDLNPMVHPSHIPVVAADQGEGVANGKRRPLTYLYRGLVPPTGEKIGFPPLRQIANNFLSMAISAHWLSSYFNEALPQMPTTEEMYEDTHERLQWMEENIPGTRGFHFLPYDFQATDELLDDMGVSKQRRSNFVVEHLGVNLSPRLYSGLAEERRKVLEAEDGDYDDGLYVSAADAASMLSTIMGDGEHNRGIDRLAEALEERA